MRILLVVILAFTVNLGFCQATKKATTKVTKPAKTVQATATAAQAQVKPNPGVHMTFLNEKLNIGKVKKGEKKQFTFEFTNTGTETIQIDNVSSCDCTTVDWPVKAIKTGEKAVLKVTFDSGKKDASETVDVDI